MSAASRALAAIASRIPAVDYCPHPDMGDDPDTPLSDTTRNDHRGSVTDG